MKHVEIMIDSNRNQSDTNFTGQREPSLLLLEHQKLPNVMLKEMIAKKREKCKKPTHWVQKRFYGSEWKGFIMVHPSRP